MYKTVLWSLTFLILVMNIEFSHGDPLQFPHGVNTSLPASKENNQATIFESLLGNQTNSSSQEWIGYVGTGISILFFGSNFVPVKKIETGDGMFFQWVLCSAIWITGLITNCIQNSPTFYPFAMLGGFLWSTGNICVVPIIKTIGLGLGMLIWGAFNMLSGWATGRFGLFDTEKDEISDPTLNTISIVLAMSSAVCWLFVKPNVDNIGEADDDDDAMLIQDENEFGSIEDFEVSWVEKLTITQRRIVGCSLSIFSGLLYGFSFAPVLHIKHTYGDSQNDLDYIFAHYCGIYVGSTVYFIIYSCYKKNRPQLYPSAILPGVVSGSMWGVAEVGWFIANKYLSPAVSFPIITSGPALVASVWGVLLFKEVSGKKNFLIMAVAYTLTITASVLAGLSKSA